MANPTNPKYNTYIGARYVPIFGGEWDNTKTYEPLVIVTDQGNSYTSVTFVPVGIDINNTTYWALTGNHNAQVEQYRQEVAQVSERQDTTEAEVAQVSERQDTTEAEVAQVSERQDTTEAEVNQIQESIAELDDVYTRLKGKTIVVVGDSLTIGSGEALGHTWVEQIAERYNCTTYNYGVSGSKICCGGSGSLDTDMINRVPGILAERPTCDYFILSGGANDKNQNAELGSTNSDANTQVIGATKNIIKMVRSKYGASCKILTITTCHRYDDTNKLGLTEYAYVDAVIRASNALGVPSFNAYNDSGISLALAEDNPDYNKWADEGFTGGGNTRAYHYSLAAYNYLTPIYAAFIANSYAGNSSIMPIYETVNGVIWQKTMLGNGVSLVTALINLSNITMGVTDKHIANSSWMNIQIPKKFQMAIYLFGTANASGDGHLIGYIGNQTKIQNWNTSGINYALTLIYGSTPASQSGFLTLSIIGFDNG